MTDRVDECELGYWSGKPFWGGGLYAGGGRGGMVSAVEVADHPYDYADTFIRNTMVFT
ncbi:hypothetical protein [Bifidobacterium catenulatum]|uniref:hypothetical protein n=1 Tax=Bifidobacterium catenulatum TaxID=1686 RepID=UPI003DA28925